MAWWSEAQGSPAVAALGVDQAAGDDGGQGVRVGAAMSALWATTTTATSNGSVDAMHDSLTPLAGLVALTGMWLNTIFGGVGVGSSTCSIYVVVAVFVAGMMIGRTPELLGKKVEPQRDAAGQPDAAALIPPLDPRRHGRRPAAIWAAHRRSRRRLSAWLKKPGTARLQARCSTSSRRPPPTTGPASRGWATTPRSGTSRPAS